MAQLEHFWAERLLGTASKNELTSSLLLSSARSEKRSHRTGRPVDGTWYVHSACSCLFTLFRRLCAAYSVCVREKAPKKKFSGRTRTADLPIKLSVALFIALYQKFSILFCTKKLVFWRFSKIMCYDTLRSDSEAPANKQVGFEVVNHFDMIPFILHEFFKIFLRFLYDFFKTFLPFLSFLYMRF